MSGISIFGFLKWIKDLLYVGPTVSVKSIKDIDMRSDEKSKAIKKEEMIKLEILPLEQTKDSTVSYLNLNGKFICYVLEDGYRPIKEYGNTRIYAAKQLPVVRLTSELSRFYKKYRDRYKNRTVGLYRGQFVLHITNVKDFKYILFHIGNIPWRTREKMFGDTLGCLLPNTSYRKDLNGHYIGIQSEVAFLKLMDAICEFPEETPIYIDINREIPSIFDR